jgi:hypothetical protein
LLLLFILIFDNYTHQSISKFSTMRTVKINFFLTVIYFTLFSSVVAQKRFTAFEKNSSLAVVQKSSEIMPRQYVDLTPDLLNSSNVAIGDMIMFEHENVEYEFRIKKVVSYMPDTYTYVASSGLRYFYYTVGNGIVTAAIHIPDIGFEAAVHHDPAYKMSYLQEHDHGDELSCGIHLVKDYILDQVDNHIENARVFTSSDLVRKMASVDDETTIKLMIVYASGALNWMLTFGSVDNVVNQSMALSQEALDVSNTKVILDLAHVAHVNYQETGLGGSALLNQLRINGDGIMDEVHSWRNTFEADIVSLFAFLSDVGGVGYLPSSPAGDDRLGFNVNRVQQMASTYTLIHEIGHNMGNMHSRNQAASAAGPTGGVFPYSTGWRWIGDDNQSYASVMTYESSPLDGVVSRRTPHFSNPQISFAGVPTGTTSFSDPFGPADNARSMREMKDVIAAYRPRATDSGLPSIASVTPAWGARGASVSVAFRGLNINAIARFSWNCGFQNVTGTINSPTQITVSANIPFNAAPGKCDVTFWTGAVNASASATGQFTITEFPITTPTVSTESVANIRASSAIISGSVSFDGGDPVFARGTCVSTSQNPTIDDICLTAGAGDGSFVTEFEGLTPSTTYNVRAYATNLAGTAYGQQQSFSTLTATNINSDSDKPAEFNLYQNFPNPFNPTTQITFSLPVGSPVDVSVYDVMGRRVTQLLDAFTHAGTHTITLDAKALPSGVYMSLTQAGEWSASRKMTLIK